MIFTTACVLKESRIVRQQPWPRYWDDLPVTLPFITFGFTLTLTLESTTCRNNCQAGQVWEQILHPEDEINVDYNFDHSLWLWDSIDNVFYQSLRLWTLHNYIKKCHLTRLLQIEAETRLKQKPQDEFDAGLHFVHNPCGQCARYVISMFAFSFLCFFFFKFFVWTKVHFVELLIVPVFYVF